MTRRHLLALVVVVALAGCVINPGSPAAEANDLAIENQREAPVTVQVTVTRDGEVVYNETHTVTDRWEREDLVEQGPAYTLRASVPGGVTATKRWNTSTACGSPTVIVREDQITIPYGPC